METHETTIEAHLSDQSSDLPDDALAALRSWYQGVPTRDAVVQYLPHLLTPGASARSVISGIRRQLIRCALTRHRDDLAKLFALRTGERVKHARHVAKAIEALRVATVATPSITTIPKIDAQHSGGVQTKQAISDGIQPPKIDANGNLVTPWVRNSMMSAFYMRAAHLGIKINPTGVPVTIHITSVRSRSDTARILLNFVDGADNLDGVVEVGDASFTIQEDTWLYWPITNWRSIEEVSNAVGEQAANGIALIAGLPIED